MHVLFAMQLFVVKIGEMTASVRAPPSVCGGWGP